MAEWQPKRSGPTLDDLRLAAPAAPHINSMAPPADGDIQELALSIWECFTKPPLPVDPAASLRREDAIDDTSRTVDEEQGIVLCAGSIRREDIPHGYELDQPSIRRVHPSIREQEPDAYEPKLVSIGPFHHGKESLKPMEAVKSTYLNYLIGRHRSNNSGTYVKAICECALRARKWYSEAVEPDEDKFVWMLVVDGCFMIECFLERFFKQTRETAQLSGVTWGFSHLRRDLMLLENQIPFFVLETLFNLSIIRFELLGVKFPLAHHVHHLLHLYHLCLDPDPHWFPTEESEPTPRSIPRATELHESGVKFKRKASKKDGVDSHLQVTFKEGILEIPFLSIEDSTSSKLRNLIALEQCCPCVGNYFTSYAVFMNNIINTESDVPLLRKHKIIESKLGNDEEVAKMFTTLCKGIHLNFDKHYNARLFTDVNKYCGVAYHRWRASLKSKYLSSPWSIIALLAGILILGLTAIQAFFAVFPRKT